MVVFSVIKDGVDKKEIKRKRIMVERIGSCKRTASNRPWSNLPPELVEEIMEKLCLADQIRLRSVCKRWRQLPLRDNRPIDKLPWMTNYHWRYEFGDEFICQVYDPTNILKPYATHKISGMHADESWLSEPEYFPCKQGWVLFLREKYDTGRADLLLFRPTTNQIVVLPDLCHNNTEREGTIRVFTFSSDPNSDECIFFALYVDYGRQRVTTSTYRRGDKQGWITNVFSGLEKTDTNVVYYQGGFYYGTKRGVLACYRVADREWYSLGNMELPNEPDGFMRTNLVVSPGGGLLFVRHNLLLGESFSLFEFSWTEMRWIHRSDLKNQALFMGRHTWDYSFAIPAFGGTAAFANKIFFPAGFKNNTQFYDVTEGKVHECNGTEFDYIGAIKRKYRRAFWIEATGGNGY